MSFINKSANYSQTTSIKTDILLPLLKTYNNYLLNLNVSNDKFILNKDINSGASLDFLIPNNNKKYYLLVTNKRLLESVKDNYNIFYFFPDEQSIKNYNNNNNVKNTMSDFYLEIDNKFQDSYLFEGYLYMKDEKYSYLLTDILIKNGSVIDLKYELRFTLLNEIILSCGSLKELNNHMSINVHPMFTRSNENLIKVFEHNFIFKSELCCVENINNFNKQRFLKQVPQLDDIKFIEMGKYTDVYDVYNKTTNNYEGILYIKGVKESKYLKELFKNSSNARISLDCKYNTHFTKWQPI